MYGATLGNHRYNFSNLATLLAKASPLRSGDILAGIAAQSGEERVAAQFALADLPLRTFLEDHLISYESDEITRGCWPPNSLQVHGHDLAAMRAALLLP
jgi:ethanolamine ammonia-lyase large subunit